MFAHSPQIVVRGTLLHNGSWMDVGWKLKGRSMNKDRRWVGMDRRSMNMDGVRWTFGGRFGGVPCIDEKVG